MLPYAIYDVFTDTPFQGNPLAIVMESDGLSSAQMLTIAGEFNLSETIFVRRPNSPEHTASVRIFFPTGEIPFAGHPTVGCSIHLAETRGLNHVTLEEVAGLVPVEIDCKDTVLKANFTAPVIPTSRAWDADRGDVAAALGLSLAGLGPHALRICTGGPSFAYIQVASDAALSAAKPNLPALEGFEAKEGKMGFYLYSPNFEARMFHPSAGILEDPATGSASALLAAQLLAEGELTDGTRAIALKQGRDMGRLSHIGFEAVVTQGALSAVRISGQACCVARGHISPPNAHSED